MKNILTATAFIALLLWATAWAQDTTPAASNQPNNQTQTSGQADTASQASQAPKIAPGSVIPVQLTKSIDAKKAKTGDEVFAKVTQDLKSNNGEVILAKDAKIVGHVTEAQARTKDQKASEVGIVFDQTVTKSGEMKLPMSIQAIIAPVQNNASAGDSGGYDQPGPATGGGTATSPMGGSNRGGQMEGAPPTASPSPRSTGGTTAGSDTQVRPPITGNTQGVIGMPDVKLEANAQNGGQGSIVSSEKSNVKLESGTIMLLRVSQ